MEGIKNYGVVCRGCFGRKEDAWDSKSWLFIQGERSLHPGLELYFFAVKSIVLLHHIIYAQSYNEPSRYCPEPALYPRHPITY